MQESDLDAAIRRMSKAVAVAPVPEFDLSDVTQNIGEVTRLRAQLRQALNLRAKAFRQGYEVGLTMRDAIDEGGALDFDDEPTRPL